ncbi:MAG TPA: hypothetical protein VHN15_10075 [Thermoanaerobaculia bacterium]|nr:hypothetical protein [Thermoanaerobaculia bacterium]
MLYRLCQERVSDLWNLIREPEWESWAVEEEARLQGLLDKKDGAAQAFSYPSWNSEEKAFVWAAAALRVLDRVHQRQWGEVAGHEADLIHLPSELGGGLTLFLPPPERPIEALIPKSRQLQRGVEDLEKNLRHILGLWWHVVLVDRHTVRPHLKSLPALVSKLLARRLQESRDLRIGLASPFAALDYSIHADPTRCHRDKGAPYRFAGIEQTCLPEARKILEQIVADCARDKVDVLCFPELTLDTDLRRTLITLLKTRNETNHPALVVTGSFHLDSTPGWVNRSHILDGLGNELLLQEKCTDYSLPGEQVTALPGTVQARLGLDERGGYEDIQLSRALYLIDGALGRLAVPICLDFCGETLQALFVETQTNLFAVPAMTPKVQPFKDTASKLGTLTRGITLFVNSAWLGQQLSLEDPSTFLYVPARRGFRGGDASGPLFLFTIRELLSLP